MPELAWPVNFEHTLSFNVTNGAEVLIYDAGQTTLNLHVIF